ncbi:MAG: hypothetical protein ACRDVL_05465 [Acidimicrobiia bacterium]
MRRLLALSVLLVVACSGSASGSDHYQLGEFFIAGPTRLSEETDSLIVENDGEFAHTLVVTRANGEVVAATPLVQPGETVSLSIDLDPGAYQFTCRIVFQEEDGQMFDHYELGMRTAVSIGG